MPRKGPAPRRELAADPIYKSVVVTQLINKVMLHGKRTVAEKIVYDAIDIIQGRLDPDEQAIDVVKRAIDNLKPPLEVRPRRATTLAIRWLVEFSRARREKSMAQCLANELMDAANGLGASMKRRDDMQKMADSNKAFAHYRW